MSATATADKATLLAEVRAANAKIEQALKTPKNPNQDAAVLDHPPSIRKGADVLSSTPFSFTKFMGLISGNLTADQAPTEQRFRKGIREAAFDTDGMSSKFGGGAIFPVCKSHLPAAFANHPLMEELYQHIDQRSESEVDIDEIRFLHKTGGPAVKKAAMSYLQANVGGTLVAPPQMGELIPLMRNKSAVNRCGATQQPLPPQGTWVAPRVTAATTGYAVPENTAGTQSNPTTGEVKMEAKKIMVLVLLPNELFRYASVSVDALLQNDMAVTLALDYDWQCLYGPGNGQIKGLVQYTGSNEVLDYAALTPAPKGIGATSNTGNTLRPEDGYRMAYDVLDRNFEEGSFKFLMRPKMKGNILSYRGDAVTAGDANASFVQSIIRSFADRVPSDSWCGFPTITSSQVRNNQTKGTATGLTEVFGGVWEHFIQGLYGAAEFFTANQGSNEVAKDQTLVRATLLGDACLRYPGAFAWYKQLLLS